MPYLTICITRGLCIETGLDHTTRLLSRFIIEIRCVFLRCVLVQFSQIIPIIYRHNIYRFFFLTDNECFISEARTVWFFCVMYMAASLQSVKKYQARNTPIINLILYGPCIIVLQCNVVQHDTQCFFL
jgi:hypothetical protein